MKKYVLLIVLFLIAGVYSYFGIENGEKEKPTNIFRIGVECDYVPNSWEERKPSGFNYPIANHEGFYADGYDIQIAKIVADKLGLVLVVKKIDWNDLLPALMNGGIDAIFSSMLDTEERKKSASFSVPYEVRKAEYAVIVSNTGAYINAASLADFSGAKILGEKGTKLDEVIDQIPGVIHLQPETTVHGMIDRVAEGTADGAVIDTDTGHFYELTNPTLELIKFPEGKGFELGFSGVCAGVRKNDMALLRRINEAVSGIKNSERQKIMDSVNSRMMTNLK